jgi:hypothetical protein
VSAVTAVNPQVRAGTGSTPAKAVGARGAKSVPPAAPSRPKPVALTPMRKEAAGLMRKLATSVQQSHPDMNVHDHLRDAAKQVEKGNEEASQRHLRAAMFSLTPQSLMRNGLHTDDAHQAGRQVMHGIHRHLLLVKDIADANAKNQAVIRRDSGDGAAVPPPRPDPNAGYGPGANAQKPTVRQPPGDQALNAPGKSDGGGSDPAVADPNSPQRPGSKQFTTRNGVRAVTELAYGWGDLGTLIELSAKTAALEVTPAPRGKPGGPGLYGVKGQEHTNYFQNVVKALIEKRGMPPGKAYAIAYGALRKWSKGGGGVHPEVSAAAAGSLAGERAKVHGHSVAWDDVDLAVDLAAAPPPASSSSTGKVQARVPAGQAGGGRFGSGTGQPDAHQQHVAHVAHMQNVAAKQQQGQQKSAASATAGKTASATAKAKIAASQQSKAGLMQQAAGFRAKADALIAQRKALQAQLASASGAVSSGQSGSTTSSGASTTSSGASTTASTAPAAGTTAAAATPATAASTTTTPAASTTALTAAQSAQIKVQVAQMTTQIIALQGQYAQAMAAAAKL